MKIDRQMAILTLLLQRGSVTAPELAQRFEVARRTIVRDIDDLCRAGIPIVTRQGTGGGISLADGYKLDKSLLSNEELQSIVVGLKGLSSIQPDSRVELLLERLAKQGRDSMVIDLASHYKGSLSEKIGILQTAIRDSQIVSFDYYSERGMERRVVEPNLVVYKWNDWYLSGYCRSRSDFRMYKLNRLWELALEDECFVAREMLESMEFDGHLVDDKSMELLFDPSVEHLLVETYGPYGYERLADGSLLYRGSYTNLEFILRWILGFGDRVQVVGPTELRELVAEKIKAMEKLYR